MKSFSKITPIFILLFFFTAAFLQAPYSSDLAVQNLQTRVTRLENLTPQISYSTAQATVFPTNTIVAPDMPFPTERPSFTPSITYTWPTPTQEFITPTEYFISYYVRVNVAGLNVRRCPKVNNEECPVIGFLNYGMIVEVFNEDPEPANGRTWYERSEAHGGGWFVSDYVSPYP